MPYLTYKNTDEQLFLIFAINIMSIKKQLKTQIKKTQQTKKPQTIPMVYL